MEEAKALYREGVMSHLEELENLSRNLSVKQEQSRRHREEVENMKERIIQLRKERDEIRANVKQQEAEIRAFTAQEQPAEEHHPGAESTQDIDLEIRLEEVKGILGAFWLTGISGKLTKKGVCVCLSTAFEGSYLDSYYVDLVLQPNPRIERHSLPAFIPLQQVAKTHLQRDLKKFLSVLFEHLNAYAGRKYQADRLQALEKIFVPGTLQRNSLCTLITFEYNVKVEEATVCFCAKLLYGDITRTLPTEATVTCKDPALAMQDTASSHSAMFTKKPLHVALDFLKAANESLVHTDASLIGSQLF
ncbi:centromere protein O [Spea bombifrons]|uniref:centromere protein O n=1 Tax=Spea bombifrons TaxID=233779 RepID=UPI00234AB191|nr:centromere protein O [Spea bombifrons]XP_053315414.1 centromere protein O [Spea bombifrons]